MAAPEEQAPSPPPRKLVAYYRVSTRKQEESGLGLDGQRAAVRAYARSKGARVIAEFMEVESGKIRERPQLELALTRVRGSGATLVIAKLDRLARNVAFLSDLMEKNVDFVACDNENATRLTIHILAAVAEDERRRISERTKAALTVYKESKRISKRIREKYPDGVPADVAAATAGRLGGSLPQCRTLTPETRRRGLEKRIKSVRAKIDEEVDRVGPQAVELRRGSMTLRGVAAALNDEGQVTRRGLPWTAVAVLRLLNREARRRLDRAR